MPLRAPQFPASLSKLDVISGGATGWVIKISRGIALKYCHDDKLNSFKAENDAYDRFGQLNPPASIMQSFLRLPGINFMPLMVGFLDERILSNQRYDYRNSLCLEVLRLEPVSKIGQWAVELAAAIAWLETLELVHGDLRPANILLDQEDHVKLADFDCMAKMGSINPGGVVPWIRLRGPEADRLEGTFGDYDACSEQFAFGSIINNLITGVELYEELGPEALDLLKNLKFPKMEDSPLATLVERCWKGEFPTLADLAKETEKLDGAANANLATRYGEDYMKTMKLQCEELLRSDLAGIEFDV